MAFALHSPRKMRKAAKAYKKWQDAAAITPAAAPTWKMNRLQRKKAANANKIALRETELLAVTTTKAAVKSARPAWRKWTPILNWQERRLNRKVAGKKAKEKSIDAQLKAATDKKKQKLKYKAQKKETKYKRYETAFSLKAAKKQKKLAKYLADIRHTYEASISVNLRRGAQQAKLDGWFNKAIAHIGTLNSSVALTECQEILREIIQSIHAGDYRNAALLLGHRLPTVRDP